MLHTQAVTAALLVAALASYDRRHGRFTPEQRESVLQAAKDAESLALGSDVVDLACETDNFFWRGLNDRQTRIALRLIGFSLNARKGATL